MDPCARAEWRRGHIRLPGAREHIKGLQNITCLDSLRSILVCLYSLMFFEVVFALSLMGMLGPTTYYKVMIFGRRGAETCQLPSEND